MDELFRRIREEQDAELNESAMRDAVEHRLARRTPMPHASSRGLRHLVGGLALAAVALLALGVAVQFWPSRTTPPASLPVPLAYVRLGDGDDVQGYVRGGAETQLRFTDGSEVSLATGALVRVVALHAHGAEVAVERGRVEVHVVHAQETRWRLLAGPYVVHVTGTRFALAWDASPARLRVQLREGSVRIEGPCLSAPHELAGAGDFEVACAAWATPTEATALVVAAPERTLEVAPREPVHRAESVVEEAPVTTAGTVEAPAEDAIDEARRALLAGETDHAEALLRSVRAGEPGSERAALAAFLLGRLCFDAQHDDAAASLWFETYARERPQGSLLREALGRRIEAEERLGHADEARLLARQYLDAFPNGPHAARARRLAE